MRSVAICPCAARYTRIHIQGEGAIPLIAITESKHIITAKYAFTSE
jgi:hypothetical protein